MNIPKIIVQLIHIHGGLKGEIQEYTDNVITIGRMPTCTVTFPKDEPGVSREHATIHREGNQYKLTDMSTYGTFVNGKQIREVFLKNGDVIEFGPGGPKVSINMEISVGAAQPDTPSVRQQGEAPVNSYQQPVAESPRDFTAPRASTGSMQPSRPPVYEAPPVVPSVQKVNAPLVIQFGPTIRTYRELPIMIGGDARADFPLKMPRIQDQHAQIFFSQNDYWIKDLTGLGMISVNSRRVETQAILQQQDEIELCPGGPKFRYLGEGRLVEMETVLEQPERQANFHNEAAVATARTQEDGNIISKLVKGFRK